MTNNFGRVLGRGGFGTVYHGYYNNIQVAVKLLSATSAQGYKEFRSEVMITKGYTNISSKIISSESTYIYLYRLKFL